MNTELCDVHIKGGVMVDDPTVGKFNVPLAELDELRRVKFE